MSVDVIYRELYLFLLTRSIQYFSAVISYRVTNCRYRPIITVLSTSTNRPAPLLCTIFVFCLQVIACCYAVRLFSGSQTLLCGNFILCGFSLFLACFSMFLAFTVLRTTVWNKHGWWWWCWWWWYNKVAWHCSWDKQDQCPVNPMLTLRPQLHVNCYCFCITLYFLSTNTVVCRANNVTWQQHN